MSMTTDQEIPSSNPGRVALFITFAVEGGYVFIGVDSLVYLFVSLFICLHNNSKLRTTFAKIFGEYLSQMIKL